jgi:hypothetical protein
MLFENAPLYIATLFTQSFGWVNSYDDSNNAAFTAVTGSMIIDSDNIIYLAMEDSSS